MKYLGYFKSPMPQRKNTGGASFTSDTTRLISSASNSRKNSTNSENSLSTQSMTVSNNTEGYSPLR